MTNFEKIKSMGVDEMTECILDEIRIDCDNCFRIRYTYEDCRSCIKDWLNSEAENRMTPN